MTRSSSHVALHAMLNARHSTGNSLSQSASQQMAMPQFDSLYAQQFAAQYVAQHHCSPDDKVTISRGEYELLLLKNQALDVLQEGITIADARAPDMPLIYANAGFCRTTGFNLQYTLGNNCRFLQGEGTDPATVAELRKVS